MSSLNLSNRLYTLPNELLLHILVPFSTIDLLPLALVSYRFHNLVLRILHHRLTIAADLREHNLLFECYHPSQKLTEPFLYCTPIGTQGLEDVLEPRASDLSPKESMIGRLGELRSLYTRFRARRRLSQWSQPRHPAGDIPGSRTHPSSSSNDPQMRAWKSDDDLVKQILSLDAHELFTQLCAQINLAKAGPKPGIFLSFVEVENGILRVWRDWMGRMDARRDSGIELSPNDGANQAAQEPSGTSNESILWIGPDRHVGVKLRVTRRTWKRDTPILFQSDEEIAVSYEIEYEGRFALLLLCKTRGNCNRHTKR